MSTFNLTRWAAKNPQLVKPGTFACSERDRKFRAEAAELRRRMQSGYVGVEQALANTGLREVKKAHYD